MRGVRIAAIADSNAAALNTMHDKLPHAALFASLDDLLQSRSVEALVIALPSGLHAAAAIAAFDAGLHVYLEKPAAVLPAEAAALAQAWRSSGTIGAIGHNLRFNPLYSRLRQMIAGGEIGSLSGIRARFEVPAPAMSSWRAPSNSGGGVLLDLGTHQIDLVRSLTGAEVEAVETTTASADGAGSLLTMEMTLTSGATATTTCAYAEKFSDTVTVIGERGTLHVDRGRSWDVTVVHDRERTRRHSPRRGASGLRYLLTKLRSPYHEPSFAIALSAWVESIRSGSAFNPDIDDGIAALLVADAARRSADLGAPVTVDQPETAPQFSSGTRMLGDA